MESYKNIQKQLLILRRKVGDLSEDKLDSIDNIDDNITIEKDLSLQLDNLGSTLILLGKQNSSGGNISEGIQTIDSQREMWKQKINNALAEQRAISALLRDVCRKRDTIRAEQQLQKGLNDRRYNLDSVVLDNEYKMSESASNSQNMVAQYIDMGKSAIEEFRRQRGILDAVQNRMVDAGHTMGLSRSVMAVIERRNFMDRLITFGGMIVILLVVFWILWWRR